MPEKEETQIEDNLGEEFEETLPFTYSITSYGADHPVDGLVKRMKSGDIYVPSFQRGFVWNFTEASRFIESLLLGLPVPGIFLSREEETQKLLVIDGQQRLRTLQYFYDGVFADTGREFALKGVQPEFDGITYKTLKDEDRRRLDDSILHATIIRQDKPSEDDSSVYFIFERLNTGGLRLQPQEIRACMYRGEFNDVLNELNQNEDWRVVYGPVNKRMRDQELILRFFALYFNSDNYNRPMKEFLNNYMAHNRYLKAHAREELESAFVPTIEAVQKGLGQRAFKPQRALNAAVFDAVMVGLARRLEEGDVEDHKGLQTQYKQLLAGAEFVTATTKATADKDNVSARIDLATQSFANVG